MIAWEIRLWQLTSYFLFIIVKLKNFMHKGEQVLATWTISKKQCFILCLPERIWKYPSRLDSSDCIIEKWIFSRTGVQSVLPTAPTVNAAFKRERRVLIQMVVLIVIYLIFWMPFWTLYTWVFACIEIYYKHNGPETTVRVDGYYGDN